MSAGSNSFTNHSGKESMMNKSTMKAESDACDQPNKSTEPPATSPEKKDSSTAIKKTKEKKKNTLDKSRQLTGKQTSSSNWFQSSKPGTSGEEQELVDVRREKDRNTSLIAHDSYQPETEYQVRHSVTLKEELILHDTVTEGISGELDDDQAKEDTSPIANTTASPRPSATKRSPENNLSFSKYQPKSNTMSLESLEIPPTAELMEINEKILKRVFNELHMLKSKSSNDIKPVWAKTSPSSIEEMKSTKALSCSTLEMSLPSFNENDLPSFTSSDEERIIDPSAKVTEESLTGVDTSQSIKFTTLFQRESAYNNMPSLENNTLDPVPSTSRHVPEVKESKKESTVLSNIVLRSNENAPKSS